MKRFYRTLMGSVAAIALGAIAADAFAQQEPPAAPGIQVPVAPGQGLDVTGDLERGQTVRNRRRPELDPLGIRAGSFFIFPQVSTGLVYNDNVYATERDERDDFIVTLRPEVDVRSNFSRHELRLQAGAEAGRYIDNTENNYIDYNIAAAGRFDVGVNGAASGGVFHRRGHVGNADPDAITGRENPTIFYITGADVGYRQEFGRFNASVGTGVEHYNFEDVELRGGLEENNDDRDRNVYSLTTRVGYLIQPGFEAFVRGTYNWVRYTQDRDDTGISRDSDGFQFVGGARVELSNLITGEVYAGYLHRTYDDPRLDDFGGVAFGGRVDWAVTQLTGLYALAQREIVETTRRVNNELASSIDRKSAAVGVDHELLRQLLLNGQIRYVQDDYVGADTEDRYWRFNLGATYNLNRNLFVSGGYTFETRDSEERGRDYNANIFLLRVGGRL